MGAVFFYHMTTQPVEVTLPMLLGKARGAGWRVVVRAESGAGLDRLDDVLWTGNDGFLAHGKSGGPHDGEQPILLTQGAEIPNGATCLVSLEGAELKAEEIEKSDRAMILFDGNDDAAVGVARGQWKALTGAGCEAQYWAQDGGRWEKKAEHPKAAE